VLDKILVGKLDVVLDDMLPEVIVVLVLRSRTDPSVLTDLVPQTSSLSQQQSPVWSHRASHQQSWSDPPPHLPTQLPSLLQTDTASLELLSGPSVFSVCSTAAFGDSDVVLVEVALVEILPEVEVVSGTICDRLSPIGLGLTESSTGVCGVWDT